MQMAISAYKNQKIKSKSKAAEIFGVPKSTLCKQLSGVKPHIETHVNSHRITVIEEKSLIKHLLDADKRGFLIQPKFLHGMAQILLRARTHNPTTTLGINWAYKFVKHYPELCIRYN